MVTKVTEHTSKPVGKKIEKNENEPPRPWMKHFGKLKHLHKENRLLNKRVEDAFEKIDQEICK
jgi:hypothetical protein